MRMSRCFFFFCSEKKTGSSGKLFKIPLRFKAACWLFWLCTVFQRTGFRLHQHNKEARDGNGGSRHFLLQKKKKQTDKREGAMRCL